MSLLGYLLAAAFLAGVAFLIVSVMLTIVRATEVAVAGTIAALKLGDRLRPREERIP